MKKVIFKRTVAVIFIFVLLCVSVLPCFAVNPEFHVIFYGGATIEQQGNINSMYSSWAYLFSTLYSQSGGEYYFFELQNSSLGGTPYASSNGIWAVSNFFTEEPYGTVNPIYKFYLPYNNGLKWNFKIMTELGNVVFDSSLASFYQDTNHANRGYFQFEWSVLGNSWYIYSAENAPLPDSAVFDYVFNYYWNNTLVDTRLVKVDMSYIPVVVAVPHIPDFVIDQEDTIIGSVTQNRTFDISVIPYDYLFNQYYEDGYDTGYLRGYEYGFELGTSSGEELGYQQGYEDGYDKGWSDGEEYGGNQVKPIRNPLDFVLSPVIAFLNLQVAPGLNLSLTLAVCITMMVIIIVLKIFAGG